LFRNIFYFSQNFILEDSEIFASLTPFFSHCNFILLVRQFYLIWNFRLSYCTQMWMKHCSQLNKPFNTVRLISVLVIIYNSIPNTKELHLLLDVFIWLLWAVMTKKIWRNTFGVRQSMTTPGNTIYLKLFWISTSNNMTMLWSSLLYLYYPISCQIQWRQSSYSVLLLILVIHYLKHIHFLPNLFTRN
jgi:hypothetical protein